MRVTIQGKVFELAPVQNNEDTCGGCALQQDIRKCCDEAALACVQPDGDHIWKEYKQ
jgi:hypothetical protein